MATGTNNAGGPQSNRPSADITEDIHYGFQRGFMNESRPSQQASRRDGASASAQSANTAPQADNTTAANTDQTAASR
ncbi:hypothetical protein IAU59_000460 [Kwoniella sp. CBS 9459]